MREKPAVFFVPLERKIVLDLRCRILFSCLFIGILSLFRKFDINTIKCCNKIILINPDNELANLVRGIQLTEIKEYSEALNCFDKIKSNEMMNDMVAELALFNYMHNDQLLIDFLS